MRFLKNEVKQETFDRSDPPILPFYSGEGGLLYVGAIQIVKADQLAKDATEWADFEWPPMFGVKVVFETAEEVPEDEQEALASAVMKSLASLADVAETSVGVTFGEKDIKVARTFSKDETKQVLLTEVVISVQDTEAETQLQEKLVDKLRNATALEGFLAGAGAKVQIEKDPTVTIVGMQRAFKERKMFVLDLVNTEINISSTRTSTTSSESSLVASSESTHSAAAASRWSSTSTCSASLRASCRRTFDRVKERGPRHARGSNKRI